MKDEKYQKLEEYLQKSGKIEIRMTLSEIQEILGFPLDPSAYKYREFWANCTASTKAYSWMDAGYEIIELDLKNEIILFKQKAYL
ncbi:MAG: hypothetical protein IKT73_03825 [Anaerotignum sp.]|nr:hypothetical protein [Anaerotignum sp.]MBR6542317.1 hypothetical protein [Anaerotignum sp.]